ncbi:MAG TPA: pilus assembly PilX N-terminal domain-containing protein [Candidatus Saccharimonadales bacterium]|nr:pilus assembly PilX N-terminal domain-containing protein [Candidatus Saccharimonadales bacterium]
MKKDQLKPLRQNEQGLVAIMVTVFFILIISLIVLSLAKIIRRENRQTLDRQLNTQAFYAAETGINDAIKAIAGGYSGPKPQCGPLTGATDPDSLKNNVIDAAHDVSYSCLTIDNTPSTLVYQDVTEDQATVVPLNPVIVNGIYYLNIFWQAKDDDTSTATFNCGYGTGSAPSGGNSFTAHGNWPCSTGILRVDVMRFGDGKLRSRDQLLNSDNILFFYPDVDDGTGTTTFTPGNSGDIMRVNCSLTINAAKLKFCYAKVGPLNFNFTGFLRLLSIYKTSTVVVSAQSSNGSPVQLSGAQAVVDSTGKATDILRRIQVRLPLYNRFAPDFALQTRDTVCKRLQILDSGTNKSATFNSTGIPQGSPKPPGLDLTTCSIPPQL